MALSRLNYFMLHQPSDRPLPMGFGKLVQEAHRRGIQVQSLYSQYYERLCYSREAEVAKRLKSLRQALESGVDGISILYDDLPGGDYGGHCDDCRSRFGSMAGEQAYFTTKVVELAKEYGKDGNIDVCPTLYWRGWEKGWFPGDERRRAIEKHGGGKGYFREFGSRKELAEINMWHCSYEASQVRALRRAGVRNYFWWYNGIRPSYYFGSPRLSTSEEVWDFPKLFWGWYLVKWKKGTGPVIEGGVMEELRAMHKKAQRVFLCTGNRMAPAEYNASLWGSFGWSPRDFDQAASEKLAFEQIFGRGSHRLAAKWDRIYRECMLAIRYGERKESASKLRAKLREGKEAVTELGKLRAREGSLLDREAVHSRYLTKMRTALSRLGRRVGRGH